MFLSTAYEGTIYDLGIVILFFSCQTSLILSLLLHLMLIQKALLLSLLF